MYSNINMSRRKKYRRKTNSRQVWKNKKAISALYKSAIENKMTEDVISGDECTADYWNNTICNWVAQGDARFEMDGSEVWDRKLHITGYIANDHGTPADCIVRLAVVKGRNTNEKAFSALDVWTGSNLVNGMQNFDNNVYRVLYNQRFAMDKDSHQIIPFDIQIKLKGKTSFNSTHTSGDQTHMMSGPIQFMYTSSIAGVVNNPQIYFQYRFQYRDS